MQSFEKIQYHRGLLNKDLSPIKIDSAVWQGDDISIELIDDIIAEGLLDMGGQYGDASAGEPVEYDHLTIEMSDRIVEIEFFNRGITLLFSNNDEFRRIHRFLSKLHSRYRKP